MHRLLAEKSKEMKALSNSHIHISIEQHSYTELRSLSNKEEPVVLTFLKETQTLQAY